MGIFSDIFHGKISVSDTATGLRRKVFILVLPQIATFAKLRSMIRSSGRSNRSYVDLGVSRSSISMKLLGFQLFSAGAKVDYQ